jgi:nuclear pore complex protein Nup188
MASESCFVLRETMNSIQIIFAISSRFQIDKIQALIMLRSFIYNQGMPLSDTTSTSNMAAELVDALLDLYCDTAADLDEN